MALPLAAPRPAALGAAPPRPASRAATARSNAQGRRSAPPAGCPPPSPPPSASASLSLPWQRRAADLVRARATLAPLPSCSPVGGMRARRHVPRRPRRASLRTAPALGTRSADCTPGHRAPRLPTARGQGDRGALPPATRAPTPPPPQWWRRRGREGREGRSGAARRRGGARSGCVRRRPRPQHCSCRGVRGGRAASEREAGWARRTTRRQQAALEPRQTLRGDAAPAEVVQGGRRRQRRRNGAAAAVAVAAGAHRRGGRGRHGSRRRLPRG
eukprot:scaffold53581_cov44-Phaeocystis_antarctica.AAC.2